MALDRLIRRRCDVAARFWLPDGTAHEGRLVDISESGAFLETNADVQIGDVVTVEITLDAGQKWKSPARVTRLGGGHREIAHPRVENMTIICRGAAVQFEEPSSASLRALNEWLSRLDDR